jgi:tetratricopeptide (TPR) repeat protein
MVLAVFLVLSADAGRGAAPPVPSGRLDALQQKRLDALQTQQNESAVAGRFTDCLRLAREIAVLRERWQGARHWQAVDARFALQRWRRLAGLPEQARKQLAESIRIDNEGVAHHARARYREAENAHRKALAIRRKVLGEEHPDTAMSYNNVAFCLDDRGKYAQALPLYEKALAIWRNTLGKEHPDTAQVYNNIAFCLSAQGKHTQALDWYEKALAIRRKVLGEEHPDTATCYNNKALCLDAQGKHAQALRLYEKALAVRRKLLGEEHPDTAGSYNSLAFCLNAQGKRLEALPLYEKALAIRRALLGERHPLTARSYTNVAFCLDDQGEHARALRLYEKALSICREVLGEEHPRTAGCYNDLAFCLNAQGKYREAIRFWQAALTGSDSSRVASGESGFDRSLFRARVLAPRTGLALAHATLNEPRLAWEYAETGLARGLLDDLTTSAEPDDRSLAFHLQQLDERLLPLYGLAKLSDGQKRLREELSHQRRDLLAGQSKRAAERSAAAVRSLEQIQKQIPADAALIFWIDASVRDGHWACLLRREGAPQWQRLPGSGRDGAWTDDDWNLTQELYQALRDVEAPAARRQLLVEAVRRQRFEPLRRYLAKVGDLPAVRRLFVVPTQSMARVPVEVLAPEYTVSYLPSGTVFARTREQHRDLSTDALLALGDPAFDVPKRTLSEPPSHGLFIRFVQPGSNAYRAGLRAGDVLLNCRATDLRGLDDLTPLLAHDGPATATLWREGTLRTVKLEPGTLGVQFDSRSARAAIRARRRAETSPTRGETYAPLPGTRAEVEALTRLVAPSRTTRLLGSLASEQQLDRLNHAGWLKRFRLIHLATHGDIKENRPDLSALILSRDRLPDPLEQARRGRKVYDGRLLATTILREWRLDADLVVLSACDTALGADAGGNGLLGFAHVFLSRGARSVVLSRWPAEDRATALLMVRFYENLLGQRAGLKKPLPRAAALAEAKAWLRELSRSEADRLSAALAGGVLQGTDVPRGKVVPLKPLAKKPVPLPVGEKPFAHPNYWATFVLIGDPE